MSVDTKQMRDLADAVGCDDSDPDWEPRTIQALRSAADEIDRLRERVRELWRWPWKPKSRDVSMADPIDELLEYMVRRGAAYGAWHAAVRDLQSKLAAVTAERDEASRQLAGVRASYERESAAWDETGRVLQKRLAAERARVAKAAAILRDPSRLTSTRIDDALAQLDAAEGKSDG